MKHSISIIFSIVLICLLSPARAEQPIAIFDACDRQDRDLAGFVSNFAERGYSHTEIFIAQKSNREPFKSAQPDRPIDPNFDPFDD
ncbi:MAG: hypothetical protein QNJ38_13880 [Prochloraceae cyanobacterium]|nr:hypothetical protein [Prochloraceae cyanobacterium]